MGTPYRKKLAAFTLAAAVAVAAVTCDRGGPILESPSGSSFLDPLTGEQARNLFEVETNDPEYWRMFTFDRYDGDSWTATNPDGSEGAVSLSAPATLPPFGDGPPPEAQILNQTFRILADLPIAHALPMAQTAEEIAGPIGAITWDSARSLAFVDGDLEAGMTYNVRSRIVIPTPEELDRVDLLAPSMYGRWTALPADLDLRIGEIAERWTADAPSDYRKVLAIQQHFHNGDFVYSTDVGSAVDDDALLEFLTRTKAGFCQQYSSAMAVMVRTLGLPARIGVGYRAGTLLADGSYLVKTSDAHVWVEVLFPGYGWLQFEPEPGTQPHPNAQAGTYLNPAAPTDAS